MKLKAIFRTFGKVFNSFSLWLSSGAGVTILTRSLIATLGIALPLAAGIMTHNIQAAMAAALAGLALGGEGKGSTFREQWPGLLYAMIAGSTAMFMGTFLTRHRLPTIIVIPALAAVTAFFGGISRPLARAATQFILFVIIAANINLPEVQPLFITTMFALGAAWIAFLFLALRPISQMLFPLTISQTTDKTMHPPKYSSKQLLRHWSNNLQQWSGWQYTLRLTSCLLAAEALAWIWPNHHGYWISITIVIVVQRDLQAAWKRSIQRTAGTLFGVMLISLFLLGSAPAWVMVVLIAVLAATRPILTEFNYTAYAAVMTLLVIILLDFGQAPSIAVIADRLIATFAGCTLALTLGYLLWFRRLRLRKI